MDETKFFEAAVGFLALGLPEDALDELNQLPPRQRMSVSALEVKLEAEIEAERWNAGADTGRLLCLRDPAEPRFFIRAARCLHETGDTAAARDWLLTGPSALIEDPYFHYQIACYHAALGDRGSARSHLRRALEMDGEYGKLARRHKHLSELASSGEEGF